MAEPRSYLDVIQEALERVPLDQQPTREQILAAVEEAVQQAGEDEVLQDPDVQLLLLKALTMDPAK